MIVLTMARRSTILFVSTVLVLLFTLSGCGTTSSEVNRRGGRITLAEGEAEKDLFIIDREAWNAAYAQGPSWLIQQVRVRPVLRNGSFLGFQVLSLFPSRPVGQPIALRVGDIIRTVNGQSIERPEHYMRLWDANRYASTLRVEVIRDRRQLEITWAIEGHASSGSPRSASVTHVPPYPLPFTSNR